MKQMNIKFPIFKKIPSRQDSLTSLIQLGEYTFSLLLKFIKNRDIFSGKMPSVLDNLKVKKYMDCVHYNLPNKFDFHLIYYFSGKLYFGQWKQHEADADGYKQGFGYYYKPEKYVY